LKNYKSLTIKASAIVVVAVVTIVLISVFHMCNPTNSNISPLRSADAHHTPQSQRRVEVSFRFDRRVAEAANQFAIWVADSDANYVRTLYVSNQAARLARNNDYFLPRWRAAAGEPNAIHSTYLSLVSGRAPRSGVYTVNWYFNNYSGNLVSNDATLFVHVEIMTSFSASTFFRSGSFGARTPGIDENIQSQQGAASAISALNVYIFQYEITND